jgi:type I restriction enzyme S subunit
VLKAAVEGRLVEQDPRDESAERLLHMLEKKPITGVNLPSLPEGWCWISVEGLSDNIVDCLHSTPRFVTHGKYCIDTTCIEPGKILFDKARFVDEETYKDRISRLEPNAGDILFSREGTIGIAVIVPANIELCLGQRMMMFRPSKAVISNYLMLAMLSDTFKRQWKPKILGTTSPHINIGDIRRMALPLPPIPEQERIIDEVEWRLSVVAQVEAVVVAGLKRAERLRQAILKQAFEGKLVEQNPENE